MELKFWEVVKLILLNTISLIRDKISRRKPKREPPKPPTLKERLDAVAASYLKEKAQ